MVTKNILLAILENKQPTSLIQPETKHRIGTRFFLFWVTLWQQNKRKTFEIFFLKV